MPIQDELDRIEDALNAPSIPRAEEEWGGAGLIVTATAREPFESGYPICVVTPHAQELSWVIRELWTAFVQAGLLDYMSKYEFFERLGRTASECLAAEGHPSARILCEAVLAEARAILADMEADTFGEPTMSIEERVAAHFGGSAADDAK